MYHSHARKQIKPAGLLLVPMIDIFTVLVTFLLMTAVFARITILQLDLPSAAGNNATPPAFRLEVIVRKDGFELTNGSRVIATVPKVDGLYDLKTLNDLAISLKRDYPRVDSASVLMEPEVEYDYMIQAMDAIRSTELSKVAGILVPAEPDQAIPPVDIAATSATPPTRVALFTKIAVGDAP
jgi:biopolymer transport protein ExbD